MNRRNSGDRGCFATQRLGVIHGEILAVNLVRTGRTTKSRIKLGDEDGVGTERLDLIRERLVEPLNNRHHKDNSDYTDTDAETGQRRSQLVCAQRVQSHQAGFFYVVESHNLKRNRWQAKALGAVGRIARPGAV